METVSLDNFLSNGLIREKQFRELVNQTNWSIYKDKRVIIKGCASVPVPTWAYLIITTQLVGIANQILYGEPCAAVKIYSKA
ncbi:MAG: hypothetical protein CMF96_01395 [Candidatus Marinimicrobia bacterium]|nr:hypothetical protein [Candidatus Neomarinimicrobiota bacterium]|tara:strand:+ start:482 stop:727 length:246 start_codon:yes stop_codon:yes gene_type:complete